MKNKRKILNIVLLFIIILTLIFLINTFRKYIIIKHLQCALEQYIISENYHVKSVADEGNGIIVTMNFYRKNDKEVMIMERNYNDEISKILMYNNGKQINTYYDNPQEKIAEINSDGLMIVNLYNYLETENDFQTLLSSITANVTRTEYNGKTCYNINHFTSTMMLSGHEKNEVIIEKDTGLFIKSNIDNIITEREYEFDNVDDKIFEEPDINQYKIHIN